MTAADAEMLGLPIVFVDGPELIEMLATAAGDRTGELFSYLNVDTHNLVVRDPVFRSAIEQHFSLWCDGFGVIVGLAIGGARRRKRGRVTLPDVFDELLNRLEAQGSSLFLLGHRPEVIDRSLEDLATSHPGLRVWGHDGFFQEGSADEAALVESINAAKPDLLYLGMGQPRQELFLARWSDQLQIGTAVCAGAVLDYRVGELSRAPRWVTDHGFEWFHRLLTEPRRLWRRYLIGIPRFAVRMLGLRLGRRST